MGVHEATHIAHEACPECGSVVPAFGDALRAREEIIDTLTEDVGNLERELRRYRSNHNRLLRERDQERRESPNYRKAMEVLEYWREKCAPRARELRGKRLENCLARLNAGYDVELLKRAVDGYAARPFVVNARRVPRGHKDDWCADAELIFREARQVEKGIAIYEAEADYQHALSLGTNTGDLRRSDEVGATTTPLGRLGQAATHYARCGIHVFPVVPGEKIPATPRGLLDATVDLVRIHRYWFAHPDHNVGLRCGKESGIVVLDVDGDDGYESLRALEAEYGALPTTASVVTPRGGQHFFFRHPGVEVRNTQGAPGPHLDMRGDGGYVLGVPSVVKGRGYVADEQASIAPMPGWLLGLLLERQGTDGRGKPAEHWGELVNIGAKSGERNGQLASYVGHLLSLGMQEPELRATAAMWNRQNVQPPLEGREVERTIDSIFRTRERAA